MENKKKIDQDEKKINDSKIDNDNDLVKIRKERRGIKKKSDSDEEKSVNGDIQDDETETKGGKRIKKNTEKEYHDEKNAQFENKIREKIENENILKIKQQQDNEKIQEMNKWIQKMKENALKEKIKKEINAENDKKKDNNFITGNALDGVFGKTISAQTDYAKDELTRIKKIEDDLKNLCVSEKIDKAYSDFASVCKANDDKFGEEKKKLAKTLDNDIKEIKDKLDGLSGTAQFDANELVKSIFAYVGDDLSTSIAGYVLICNKINTYKNNIPINKMEFDEKSGKDKNVLDGDIVEERKSLNTALDNLLNNTDLFSTSALKEEIYKRYQDISRNNATTAVMTFIYALLDVIFGTNRHKDKIMVCSILDKIYTDLDDVNSFASISEARKRLIEHYDEYWSLLMRMPTWIFYPNLLAIDGNNSHVSKKKDILEEFMKKVVVDVGYSDKVKFISRNIYKIVGGNSFHVLSNMINKRKMEAIIDAICDSEILPFGFNDRELYRKIIRKTIELPPDTGKEKEGEGKVDKIMKDLNIKDKSLRKAIESICDGYISTNKKNKSGKSSSEKQTFKDVKFAGDKLMVDNDEFDAKKKSVTDLIGAVACGLDLNIDQTMTYLCNINSIDIDMGAKKIADNHKVRLRSMVESQRSSLLGIVEEKFADDGGSAKQSMESVKKMVDAVKSNDFYDKKNEKPKVGKMIKYNDLEFDFRDLSNEANKIRKDLKNSINEMCDKMIAKIDSIDVEQNHDKQRISLMMKDMSDGTRKDYKEIEIEKAKYNKQTMDALMESMKNSGKVGRMMPHGYY